MALINRLARRIAEFLVEKEKKKKKSKRSKGSKGSKEGKKRSIGIVLYKEEDKDIGISVSFVKVTGGPDWIEKVHVIDDRLIVVTRKNSTPKVYVPRFQKGSIDVDHILEAIALSDPRKGGKEEKNSVVEHGLWWDRDSEKFVKYVLFLRKKGVVPHPLFSERVDRRLNSQVSLKKGWKIIQQFEETGEWPSNVKYTDKYVEFFAKEGAWRYYPETKRAMRLINGKWKPQRRPQ